MKIIKPSAHIIEDEIPKNVYQRIDACASVCYQRPNKPTVEEAEQFCRSMVERGHLTTLEMVLVYLVCDSFSIPQTDYIQFAGMEGYENNYVMVASIRGLLEAERTPAMQLFLHEQFPLFFEEPWLMSSQDISDHKKIRFAEPNEIPWQHKHVAARFIVNRAVSHELVRHRPCSFLQESQRYCRYEDEVTFIRPEWWDKEYVWAEKDWMQHMEASEIRYRRLLSDGLKPQQARAVLPNSTKTEVICYASLPQWLHMFNLRCSPAADPEMRRVMVPLREEFKEKYPEAFE